MIFVAVLSKWEILPLKAENKNLALKNKINKSEIELLQTLNITYTLHAVIYG